MAKFLLVDDSRITLKKMRRSFVAAGVEDIQTANNGVEAMELLKVERFDLIISDIHMPEMDGLELVKEVTSMNIGTPIVVCTADQQESTRTLALEYGAVELFNKPDLFDVDIIKKLIHEFAAS